MFGVPEAGHFVSRKMSLPVLFVVWNNARWNAVKSATSASTRQPRLPAPTASVHRPRSEHQYHKICEAAGGYGEFVEDPAQVKSAFERALHAVRVEGRQALLNIAGA